MAKDKFYIATPIYYANDVPHIGHTGTTVFADIISRYQKLLGKDVFFLTGTDDHGEKVALAAEKAGKDPKEFVDELAIEWQEYWKTLNISNNEFIRTSSEGHKKVAQELLQKLYDKGDVYEDYYKGVYCVGCEEFKAEKDLVDGKCPEHRPDQIQYKEEKNYFFRISKYIPTVKKYLEEGTLPLIPENKKNEMLARLDDEIHDTSISRQDVSWGIPIPWDESQTTYVWVEALMNYYTATQIYDRSDLWPNNLNILGKGNNWFHSVIWPSLLLALELPLPKELFVHGYYNVEGQKMGKSLGNVISPKELMDKYGVDGTRYLLAASMPYANDSDVSFKWFDEKYNSDLANSLGNLVSRVAKLSEGKDLGFGNFSIDINELLDANPDIKKAYDEYRLHDAVSEIQRLVKETNEYFSEKAPWKLEGEEQEVVLKEATSRILEASFLLSPVMPETNEKIRASFVTDKVVKPEILFKRV